VNHATSGKRAVNVGTIQRPLAGEIPCGVTKLLAKTSSTPSPLIVRKFADFDEMSFAVMCVSNFNFCMVVVDDKNVTVIFNIFAGVAAAYYSYDIACLFLNYLRIRDPTLFRVVKDKIVLGYFHGLSHKCRAYNTGFTREGAGYCDGEQSERLNSLLVLYSSFMRYMREENFKETLTNFLYMETKRNNMRSHKVILKKMESMCNKVVELKRELQKLCIQKGLSPSNQEMQLWASVHTQTPVTSNDVSEQLGKKLGGLPEQLASLLMK
jgi:hypothetical protein